MISFSQSPRKDLMVSGIYLIRIDKYMYVGSSINVRDRIRKHRAKLAKGKHDNRYMQNRYIKHGVKSSSYCLLEKCKPEVRLIREKYWIDTLSPDLNSKQDPMTQYNSRTQSKVVYCYDLKGKYIGFYPSTKEAERQLNIASASISAAARGSRNYKSAGNYLWSYDQKDMTGYQNFSSASKIKQITMFNKLGEKLIRFNSIADAARYLQEPNDKFDSLCATISSAGKNQKYSVKNKYLFSHDDVDTVISLANKNAAVIQILADGREVFWNSASEAAKTLNIVLLTIHTVLRGERKTYKESQWITARTKQGELLGTPTAVIANEDNQQPSLSSNTLEGSTTNTRLQTDNAEESNGNTSALQSKPIQPPGLIHFPDGTVSGGYRWLD